MVKVVNLLIMFFFCSMAANPLEYEYSLRYLVKVEYPKGSLLLKERLQKLVNVEAEASKKDMAVQKVNNGEAFIFPYSIDLNIEASSIQAFKVDFYGYPVSHADIHYQTSYPTKVQYLYDGITLYKDKKNIKKNTEVNIPTGAFVGTLKEVKEYIEDPATNHILSAYKLLNDYKLSNNKNGLTMMGYSFVETQKDISLERNDTMKEIIKFNLNEFGDYVLSYYYLMVNDKVIYEYTLSED